MIENYYGSVEILNELNKIIKPGGKMASVGRPAHMDAQNSNGAFAQTLIGYVIKHMKEHKLSQSEMAKRIGIHAPAFNRIMKGGNITIKTIQNILDAMKLEISISEKKANNIN